ncbi:protein FAM209A [Dromiciops gliroides]|uniref:protein FAM209A n=1 Tax=Dromiciops gliroides TaxID=33562 RepID=UPI001CC3B423|nr:protein FAM209A [Dromiciops gliroides]
MHMLKCFLFFLLCSTLGYGFTFSSLREKAKEPVGDVPCGGHFRMRQNLSDQAKGWLGSKWIWMLFVGLLYAVVRFRGEGDRNKDKDLNSGNCSYRPLQKKNQNAAPNKDYALNTLTQLEMDLVTFVSKVRSLKVAMATGNSLKLPGSEVPSDSHNNITIYEIWGEDDSD